MLLDLDLNLKNVVIHLEVLILFVEEIQKISLLVEELKNKNFNQSPNICENGPIAIFVG
jgi:hypothetical protein